HFRPVQAFEEKMVEAEGRVESRIAVPGAFGVEEHRAKRAGHDVLRTDIAVDERARRRGGAIGECVERSRHVAMAPSGRAEIGIEPERLEDPASRECRRYRHIAGGRGVDGGEPAAHRGRKSDIDLARHQGRLPQPEPGRVEIIHGEKHRRVVMREDARRAPRDAGGGDLEPATLVAIALDRREPFVLDRELRHGALDAEDPAAGLDAPDLRGDAAGQALGDVGNAGGDQSESAETGSDIVGEWGRPVRHCHGGSRTRGYFEPGGAGPTTEGWCRPTVRPLPSPCPPIRGPARVLAFGRGSGESRTKSSGSFSRAAPGTSAYG